MGYAVIKHLIEHLSLRGNIGNMLFCAKFLLLFGRPFFILLNKSRYVAFCVVLPAVCVDFCLETRYLRSQVRYTVYMSRK